MVRLLIVCLPLLVFPRGTATDLASTVAASRRSQDSLTERAETLVRKRFALSASSADCRYADNLYGYHLLLTQLPEAGKRRVRSAEVQGRVQGKTQQIDGSAPACVAALAAMRAADDALVVMAEQAADVDAAVR